MKTKASKTKGRPLLNTITSKRHGDGSLRLRRIRLGLTRNRMAELGGIPVSRIVRAEEYVADKERGEPTWRSWSPALQSVADLMDRLEREDAEYDAAEAAESASVAAAVSVAADPWHLKRLQEQLPQGSKITITLPSGLELKVL